MNYVYQFDPEVKTTPILLNKNSFIWPQHIPPADTVLLKLDVKDKILKKINRPYLEIKSINHISKQYIERHNQGIRYFNLSEIANNIHAGQPIKLTSNRLTWHKQAELLFFQNNISNNAKVLIIAPHPDDAELAAFGFYSSHNSHIITITVGEGGRIDYCKMYSGNIIEQRLFQAKTRMLDSLTVPLRGGIPLQKNINLGYFNMTLLPMYQNPDKPIASLTTGVTDPNVFRKLNISDLTPTCSGQATWTNLITDLVLLINHIKPNIIILPHPILDKHPDHRLSALATFEALSTCNLNHGKFLFYVNHSNFSTKYPFGHRYSLVTVPPNFQDSVIRYSVYSYPLTWQQQIEKLFALNAMHDIAPIPGELYNTKNILIQKLTQKSKYTIPWLKYYRKAVRANELFLVVPFAQSNNLSDLTKTIIKT